MFDNELYYHKEKLALSTIDGFRYHVKTINIPVNPFIYISQKGKVRKDARQASRASLPAFGTVGFLAMEYIHDGDLSQHISRIHNVQELCSLFTQIMYCFIELSQKYKIYHGDINSGNVLIDKTDDEYSTHIVNGEERRVKTFGKIPKIIDFGRSSKYYGDSPSDMDIIHDLTIAVPMCNNYVKNESIKKRINSMLIEQVSEYTDIDNFVNKIIEIFALRE